MGNHKFRISDMIPNAWFYKLRDMGKTRNKNKNTKKKKIPITTSSSSTTSSSLSNSNSSLSSSISTSIPPKLTTHRKSHYFTRDLSPTGESYPKFSPTHSHDFPGKSPKQKITTKNRATNKETPELVTTTVSSGCGCRATVEAVRINNNNFHIAEDYPVSHVDSLSDFESHLPKYGSDHNNSGASWSSYSSCQRKAGNDIVFNINDTEIDDGFDSFSKLELPQIITKKPTKSSDSKTQVSVAMKKKKKKKIDSCTISEFRGENAHGSLSMEGVKESRVRSSTEQRSIPVRRISASSPGLRIRTNSPRIIGRKFQNGRRSCRRSLSESLAVVKTSVDPQRDFTDSMVDMIVENNIRGSEDLEDLLACYLQLNSDVYHELIIKVFKQIWFDLEDIRLK